MIDIVLALQLFLQAYVIVANVASSDYGEWGSWGEWSKCSVTCGYGSVQRNKNWIYKNGLVSNYTYSMIVECWTKLPCPVNGGWTMWTAWSDCSKMCGSGSTARTRLCIAPEPSENGRDCEGLGREEKVCNNIVCPELPIDFDMSLCNDTTFQCASGLQCIPEVYHCDQQLHCHDGSDEMPDECRRFSNFNSGGNPTSSLLTTVLVLMTVLTTRLTTNHPV